MTPIRQRSLVIGLLIGVASTATGQTPPERKPLPAPVVTSEIPSRTLLQEPAVQREIGLSEKQKNNLSLVEADALEARQANMAAAGEEEFDFTTMMSGIEDLAKQERTATSKLLSPAQRNRLLQIEWQREGWLALGRADVATRIRLTVPQSQKIRSIIVAMRQQQAQAVFALPDAEIEARKKNKPKPKLSPSNGFLGDPETVLPGGGPMGFTAAGLEAQSLRTAESATKAQGDAAKEVAEILSPEQRAAFDRLLGPTFDFKGLNPPRDALSGVDQNGSSPAKRPTGTAKKSPRTR